VQIQRLFSRRIYVAAAALTAVVLVGWLFAYQPVTRNLVARDGLCTYCHIEQEYVPTLLTSVAKPHPRTPESSDSARCVDCHLPKGFWQTTFAYTHFASMTDLFGYSRDRDLERAADWIPPRAATTHRVRVRMYEHDSVTCRECHIESAIRPESIRGRLAHRQAWERNQTCIECHYNMAHRQVDLRVGTFDSPKPYDAVKKFAASSVPDFDVTPISGNFPER